jgi:hypothetical protein
MKVAICYWGTTRSTKKVYQTHQDNVIRILKENNISYKIFMHTWKTDNNKAYVWNDLVDSEIDYEEYKLLSPDEYVIENQDTFLNNEILPNFSKYYRPEEYEWLPQLIRNHLCALESQKRVTNMLLNSDDVYDFVLYLRPDVEFVSPFPMEALNIPDCDIAIPDDEHCEGYNDRCAIVPYNMCSFYGRRINEIIEFRDNFGRIVSEKFAKHIMIKYYSNVHFVYFRMNLIRP